jgi:pimeloyl-ACP methyl ester carboxylesterase
MSRRLDGGEQRAQAPAPPAPEREISLAHDVHGSGPPLLMIQGLGYGRTGWGAAPMLLARRFRVVTPDNRGFGGSEITPGPYTTAQLAADALTLLDALEIDRAHVLGISLGGMIAQELVLAAPQRVSKLVLCSTTAGGATAVPMPEKTVALMGRRAELDPQEAMRLFVENALSPSPPDGLVDEIVAYRVANPPDGAGWYAQASAGAAHDAMARLGKIAAPTLVLHGTADNVVDAGNAQLIAEAIPGARLVLFEGVGHLLPWERPEEFAGLVEEFLA